MNDDTCKPEIMRLGEKVNPKPKLGPTPPAHAWKPHTTPGLEVNGLGQLRTAFADVHSHREWPRDPLPKPQAETPKAARGWWTFESAGGVQSEAYDGVTLKDVPAPVRTTRHPWVGIDEGRDDKSVAAMFGSGFGHMEIRPFKTSPVSPGLQRLMDAAAEQMANTARLSVNPLLLVGRGMEPAFNRDWDLNWASMARFGGSRASQDAQVERSTRETERVMNEAMVAATMREKFAEAAAFAEATIAVMSDPPRYSNGAPIVDQVPISKVPDSTIRRAFKNLPVAHSKYAALKAEYIRRELDIPF